MTRIPSSGRAIKRLPSIMRSAQQVAGDYHAMDFRGAFANTADARLTIPSLERELLADAVAPMDLHRAIHDPAKHFTGVKFGNRGFHPRVFPTITLPRPFPCKPSRRTQFDF